MRLRKMSHAAMVALTLFGLSLNGYTWRDARQGHASVPSVLWPVAVRVFPSCRTAGSDWCVWDAANRGTPRNGRGMGESFISVAGATIIFD